jgi:hypothetical protein
MIKTMSMYLFLALGILGSVSAYSETAAKTDIQPAIYIDESSHGHRILILVNGKEGWNGVVPESKVSPNINTVKLPKKLGKRCKLVISGGPYKLKRTIDWSKGPRITLSFGTDGTVNINQDDGKAGFE